MRQAFWTSTSKYGIVHKASRRDQSEPRGCLVVFVHGIFGDCSRTWGNVPEWILESGGIDVDVISFAYSSQIWQRCSIPVAAEDLRTWLETEFCNHRHLLFVTHSTGGLIVKQMLRQAYGEVKAQLDNRAFDISSSVWLRTRHVINIAVPHSGGSPFITAFAKVTYHSVFPLMAPILKLARFVTQGPKGIGDGTIFLLRYAGRTRGYCSSRRSLSNSRKSRTHRIFRTPWCTTSTQNPIYRCPSPQTRISAISISAGPINR